MIIDGQPPEIASLILDAEYDAVLSGVAVSVKTAMSLQLIKELSWHIHYDEDYYGYLLSTYRKNYSDWRIIEWNTL